MLFRRMSQPDIVIHKKKFVFLAAVESPRRYHSLVPETRRLRRGISIKCGIFYYLHIAGPKSVSDHFTRVSFFGYEVCVRTFRSGPAGKTRRRQIKTAPEKMYRASLADES